MNKVFLFATSLCALLFFASYNNQAKLKTRQHEDGSTHSDHAPDTAKLQQQKFIIGDSTKIDTTKDVHTHKNGKKHSH